MAERTLDNELYDNHGEIDLAGSANAYTATTARAITGYYKGLRISAKANHTNTGASTLNVNGIGAAAIRKLTSVALVAGDMVSGQYYDFSYDFANGWFQLLNPSTVSAVGGFPLSASGDRWGVIPVVGTDGVMEVGRYIDFHNSDADTGDAANRVETNGGTVGLFESPNLGGLKRIVSLTNSSLAQGDVIYYDGTNFVRLAPGTSGQFLKTNGAAANPAWATVSQPVTPVIAGAISGLANLDIALGSADMYEIDLINFAPATDNTSLLMQFSQSGSFLSGASDYAYGLQRGGVTTASGAASSIFIVDSVGNNTNEINTQTVRIFRPSASAFAKTAIFNGLKTTTSTVIEASHGGGRLAANTNAIDGVRFLFSSGNIASGYYAARSYSFT